MLQVAELCKLNSKPCQVSHEQGRTVSRKDEGLTAAWGPENIEVGSNERGGLESPEPAEAPLLP